MKIRAHAQVARASVSTFFAATRDIMQVRAIAVAFPITSVPFVAALTSPRSRCRRPFIASAFFLRVTSALCVRSRRLPDTDGRHAAQRALNVEPVRS